MHAKAAHVLDVVERLGWEFFTSSQHKCGLFMTYHVARLLDVEEISDLCQELVDLFSRLWIGDPPHWLVVLQTFQGSVQQTLNCCYGWDERRGRKKTFLLGCVCTRRVGYQ